MAEFFAVLSSIAWDVYERLGLPVNEVEEGWWMACDDLGYWAFPRRKVHE